MKTGRDTPPDPFGPFDQNEAAYYTITDRFSPIVRDLMARLNESNTADELKTVELTFGSDMQGIAKMTLTWTPPPGKSNEELLEPIDKKCPACHNLNHKSCNFCPKCGTRH